MGNAELKHDWHINVPIAGSYLLGGFEELHSKFDSIERLIGTMLYDINIEFQLESTTVWADGVITDRMKRLLRSFDEGECCLHVRWIYEAKNKDILDFGKTLSEILELEFEFIEIRAEPAA